MTRFVVRAALTAGLAGLCALGGCALEPGCPAVPAVQAETIPPPPPSGEQQVWEPGHWNYQQNQFFWEPGHYIPYVPGRGGWIPGAFALGPNGACNWVPAHWLG